MTLTAEDVGRVVEDKTKHIEKAIQQMANSMEKFADTLQEQVAQSRASDEKFLRCHERIDKLDDRQDNTDGIIMTLATDVAVNSFSAGKFWKISLTLIGPLIALMWAFMSSFRNTQLEQSKAVLDVLKELSKALGAG